MGLTIKILRYVAASVLAVWIGAIVKTLMTARSIFDNESGRVPDSGAAGDIVGPLLDDMHLIGWIACGVAIASIVGIRFLRKAPRHIVIWSTVAVLAIALLTGFYSGVVLTEQIQELRVELATEYGSYDAAPEDAPARKKFGMLHGVSMSIALLNLVLALSAFYTVTQEIGLPRRSTDEPGAEYRGDEDEDSVIE